MSAYHQIRTLHDRADIHLLTFIADSAELRALQDHIGTWCKTITGVAYSRFSAMAKLPLAPLRLVPLQTALCSTTAMRRAAHRALNDVQPNVVHVQTIRVADPFWEYDGAKVMDMIDAISLNMARRAERERAIVRPSVRFEAALAAQYEKRVLSVYDGVTVVAENDATYLRDDRVVVNPLGTYIDDDLLRPYREIPRENAMMFHGNMYYFPNVDGMTWFAREVWPEVHRRHPEFRFYIAGNKPAAAIQALHNRDNIVVTGFVEDMVAYLRKCTIGVYPLNSGTGMQTKILEALAAGLPLVASPLALQGIPGVEHDTHVLVAETSDNFVAQIDRLLADSALRDRLAAAGQDLVRARFSWKSNADTLLGVWERAAERCKQRTSIQHS